MRLLIISLVIVLTLFIPSRGFCQDNQPSHYILDNGLSVIIKEVPAHPIVSLVCVVKAGSATEGKFTGSGISHFIEHMLFKGTAKRGVGEIARQIRNAGGEISAYTTFDYTQYEITLPSQYLGEALDILGDVLSNASFDPQEMEKERKVILNEMRQNNDNPQKFLSKLFWSTAFREHPYRTPVIGYKELLLKLTRKDLLRYYRQMYIPNNIIFSIAGDVETEEAFLKVKEAFKNFKRGIVMPYAVVQEPVQISKREVVEVAGELDLAHLFIGFHGPDIASPDLYAMDVMAIILGGGRSSRLYKQLKEEKQLVSSISAFSYTPRDPGIFGITALLDQKDLTMAEEAIGQELDRIKRGNISKQELNKARKTVLADYIFSLQTVEAQARDLSINEALTGDFNFSKRYIEGVNSVIVDDIKRVALKYLIPDNLTQAILVPEKEGSKKIDNPKKAVDLPIKKIILDNGLIILLKENHLTPTVSIRAVIKGGVRVENQDNNGLSLFSAKMLLKGTKKRSGEQIFQEIESVGGKISSYSGNNSLGICLDILSEDLERGIDILMDILANSVFSQKAIGEVKREIIAQIEKNQEDSFYLAHQALKTTLFKSHPYRFEVTGTKESVSDIDRQDLLEFYNQYISTNNMVIAIFGDININKIIDMLNKKSKTLNSKSLAEISVSQEPVQTEKRETVKYVDKSEAITLLGFHSIALNNQDRYIFEVITNLLSGQAGRLFKIIREDLGLSYSVGSYHIIGLDPGYYLLYSASSPQEVNKVKDLLFDQVELLKTVPVDSVELEHAKNSLIGHWTIELQANGSLAFISALDELYGLGYANYKFYSNKINRITPEDIIRLTDKYFDPKKTAVVTIIPRTKKK